MIYGSDKERVLAKLISARNELDDALRLSVPAGPSEPAVIPQAVRNELSVMRDDLARLIQVLERS